MDGSDRALTEAPFENDLGFDQRWRSDAYGSAGHNPAKCRSLCFHQKDRDDRRCVERAHGHRSDGEAILIVHVAVIGRHARRPEWCQLMGKRQQLVVALLLLLRERCRRLGCSKLFRGQRIPREAKRSESTTAASTVTPRRRAI